MQQRDAVAVEETGLEEDHVRSLARQQRDVGGARGGADGDETRLAAQEQREPRANGRLGVDDGDARHVAAPSQPALSPT